MAPKRIIGEFWDDATKKAYEEDSMHPVQKSFGYDYEDLEKEGFKGVCDLLDFQGWKYISSILFCNESEGIDHGIVRLFFANFKFSSTNSFVKTIIKRTLLAFTPNDLEDFIVNLCPFDNIRPNDNNMIYLTYGCDESSIEGYDSKISYKELLAPEFYEITKPTTSHLTRDNRLLTHILYHSIIPHEGSLTSLSGFTLMILYCINHRIKVHLPTLIISHMNHAKSISNHRYPYGMLITLFVKHFANVQLSRIRDHAFVKYDKTRLNNIFYFDDFINEWVFSPKKRKRSSDQNSQEPSSSYKPLSPNKPFISSTKGSTSKETDPSMSSSLKMDEDYFEKLMMRSFRKIVKEDLDKSIGKLEKIVTEKLDEFENRLDTIEVRIGARLDEISSKMNSAGQIFQAFGKCLKVTHDMVKVTHDMVKQSHSRHYDYF